MTNPAAIEAAGFSLFINALRVLIRRRDISCSALSSITKEGFCLLISAGL
jgi:hypothetical protein